MQSPLAQSRDSETEQEVGGLSDIKTSEHWEQPLNSCYKPSASTKWKGADLFIVRWYVGTGSKLTTDAPSKSGSWSYLVGPLIRKDHQGISLSQKYNLTVAAGPRDSL